MARIGLALSGGGFRASIFHLGLVRFLSDAGALQRVTHITSVSGGSVFAAHLVLNWDRYCGSKKDFEQAASEFLRFMRFDVRNHILRRYPFTIPIRWLAYLVNKHSHRHFTRTGLLESYYRKHLYGDTSLFELPKKPQLHILTTNLSEGGLCSFYRDGLIMQRYSKENASKFDYLNADLATVSMAVAASSAFPGFYPPLNLDSTEVGAEAGKFGRQSFTDGGIFDNLGIRMFRFIEHSWLGREVKLHLDDFIDINNVLEALNKALIITEDVQSKVVADILLSNPESGTQIKNTKQLLEIFSKLILEQKLYRVPTFENMTLRIPDAQLLLESTRNSAVELDREDHIWLNRQILGEVLQIMTGKKCLRPFSSGLDCVLVSDAGKPFQRVVQSTRTSIISTSLRASDILMDRVGQLENEAFKNAAGFLFVSTMQEVTQDEDNIALPVEVQRRIANIRTDMDEFSKAEISSLLRHGYCVGRKLFKEHPEIFGKNIPDNPPWDPYEQYPKTSKKAQTSKTSFSIKPSVFTKKARVLQISSGRSIWRNMFDFRDWISYLYVPIIVPLLVLLPYFSYKYHEQTVRIQQLNRSVTQSLPGYLYLSSILSADALKKSKFMKAMEVSQLAPVKNSAVSILSSLQIIDLRSLDPDEKEIEQSHYFTGMRFAFRKVASEEKQQKVTFRIRTESPKIDFNVPEKEFKPMLYVHKQASSDSKLIYVWDIVLDVSTIPVGNVRDVIIEYFSYDGIQGRKDKDTWVRVSNEYSALSRSFFIIMPTEYPFKSFELIQFPDGKPGLARTIKPYVIYQPPDNTRIGFSQIGEKQGYVEILRWKW